MGNCRSIPAIGIILRFYIAVDTLTFVVSGRGKDLPLLQQPCDLRRPVSVHHIQTNIINHIGCIVVPYPLLRIGRVFHIPVRCIGGQVFSRISFDLHNGPDLLTCVLGVPLVDDVPKRGKLVVALLTVHSIVDSNKVNIVLREHDLSIHSHLQVVTAQTGHILDNDPLDNTCFNVRNHFLEPRAVKGGAGDAIVNIKTDILPAMVKGILL